MIIETIELISKELLDIDTLQSRINNGEFNDILLSHPFLIMTNKGLCLVQKDGDDANIKFNAVVDLSNYVDNNNLNNIVSELLTQKLENEIPDVSNFITTDILDKYAKISDLPTFSFSDDGTLSVTINGVTNLYAPIANN